MTRTEPRNAHTRTRPALLSALLLAFGGCASDAGSESTTNAAYDDDAVASVQIELRSVPSSARCVQITISSGTVLTRSFDLVTGASTAALDLGRLAAGSTTFAAAAYSAGCALVTTSTIADWVGNPVTALVQPGINPAIAVTLVPNVPTTIAVDFKQPVAKLIGGTSSTFALLPNGTVSAWGSNEQGVLADGTTTSRLTPQASPLLTDIAVLAASPHATHTACAVTNAGTLLCWGDDFSGQLGDGSAGPGRTTPFPSIASGISNVTLGDDFTCALRASDRRPLCAGYNASGQLGNGAAGSVIATFQPVMSTLRFTSLEASTSAVCGIVESGDVVCWGENIAFGNGSTSGSSPTPAASPVQGMVELAFGSRHYCGLRGDGSVWCWGQNDRGQLGDGTATNRYTPVRVTNVSGVVQIAAGEHSTCARLENGTVKCWGAGMHDGAVGDGTGMTQYSAVQVRNLSGAVWITAGRYHMCAKLASGDVQCWGSNPMGQIGDGTTTYRLTPVSVQW